MQLTIGGLGEYVSVCCRCGCALKAEEISATMKGTWTDLEINTFCDDACLTYCKECKEITRKYANEPVRKAWLRSQQLEHL